MGVGRSVLIGKWSDFFNIISSFMSIIYKYRELGIASRKQSGRINQIKRVHFTRLLTRNKTGIKCQEEWISFHGIERKYLWCVFDRWIDIDIDIYPLYSALIIHKNMPLDDIMCSYPDWWSIILNLTISLSFIEFQWLNLMMATTNKLINDRYSCAQNNIGQQISV